MWIAIWLDFDQAGPFFSPHFNTWACCERVSQMNQRKFIYLYNIYDVLCLTSTQFIPNKERRTSDLHAAPTRHFNQLTYGQNFNNVLEVVIANSVIHITHSFESTAKWIAVEKVGGFNYPVDYVAFTTSKIPM